MGQEAPPHRRGKFEASGGWACPTHPVNGSLYICHPLRCQTNPPCPGVNPRRVSHPTFTTGPRASSWLNADCNRCRVIPDHRNADASAISVACHRARGYPGRPRAAARQTEALTSGPKPAKRSLTRAAGGGRHQQNSTACARLPDHRTHSGEPRHKGLKANFPASVRTPQRYTLLGFIWPEPGAESQL